MLLAALLAALVARTTLGADVDAVPAPTFPPPAYPYTESWQLTLTTVPSPFVGPADVYHTRPLEDPCGVVALISDPQVDRLLNEAVAHRRPTYRAHVAWYRIADGCAHLLYFIEYADCDPRQIFGRCRRRTTPMWWTPSADYMFPTEDELGLLMVAPGRFNEGQYRRLVSVDGVNILTDFMVALPEGQECPFARVDQHRTYKFGACWSDDSFKRGVDVMRFLTPFYQQPPHREVVNYWYRKNGRTLPRAYAAGTPYAIDPARPSAGSPRPRRRPRPRPRPKPEPAPATPAPPGRLPEPATRDHAAGGRPTPRPPRPETPHRPFAPPAVVPSGWPQPAEPFPPRTTAAPGVSRHRSVIVGTGTAMGALLVGVCVYIFFRLRGAKGYRLLGGPADADELKAQPGP
uniref:Glycoprotein gD n=1 Tax=Suid herpesvirus 1 TaxID=10345 RepID=A0A2U8JN59_SUHV|nr:glycoprotein gD [Suid alphaherpesvirus 1]